VRTSSSRSKQLTNLGWALEEWQILLCLRETDLVVQEAILAEELERDMHPPDAWVLSVELDKALTRADRIDGERAAETEHLSRQVMRIFDDVVDLGMLLI
jgi:hypothetical protein